MEKIEVYFNHEVRKGSKIGVEDAKGEPLKYYRVIGCKKTNSGFKITAEFIGFRK